MTTILWEQQVQKSDQEVFFAEAGAIALCGYVVVESGGYEGMWVGESSNKSDLEILMHVWVLRFWENVAVYFFGGQVYLNGQDLPLFVTFLYS